MAIPPIAIAAVISVTVAACGGMASADAGVIRFGRAQGDGPCSVADALIEIHPGAAVFYAARLRTPIGRNVPMTLRVMKDSALFLDSGFATSDDTGCVHNVDADKGDSLPPLEAGVYKFELVRDRDIEASGTLVIR